ncbi:MAG: hypothetical protein HQ522_10260, partial [Bacteroidetes bacterium]|nr:hypothetical protein [Bacteroidota bacterium]
MKSKKWILFLLPVLVMVGIFAHKPNATYLLGEARWRYDKLPESNIEVPTERTIQWNSESEFATRLIQEELKREVAKVWDKDKKSGSPKAILRQFLAEENIPEVNRLMQEMQPWGTSGSAWLLNPNGGYNFALTPFTTILYLFDDKPDILYPATKKHLLEVLLINEGGDFSDAVPNMLGRVKDSENHILMAQGSKYLKNHYMWLHGKRDKKYNNLTNGMEEGILNLLNEHKELGLYEFNSVPYSAYAITPLLNLEAFGSDAVQKSALDVLDYICFTYALGSYNFKYYPPFRRRLDRHKTTSLSKDYETVFMKSWLSFHPEINYNTPVKNGNNHAMMAVAFPYRPADKVVDLIFDKSQEYFVKLGHGVKSCPEIYSAGAGYLLSAGGANQGKWSIIVARPTCLFLDDDAEEITDVIHLKGKGKNFMKWNDTGVYKDFACTNGTIFIPEKYKIVAENKLWKIYNVDENLSVAVHSSNNLSILSICKNQNPKTLASNLLENNSEINKLH